MANKLPRPHRQELIQWNWRSLDLPAGGSLDLSYIIHVAFASFLLEAESSPYTIFTSWHPNLKVWKKNKNCVQVNFDTNKPLRFTAISWKLDHCFGQETDAKSATTAEGHILERMELFQLVLSDDKFKKQKRSEWILINPLCGHHALCILIRLLWSPPPRTPGQRSSSANCLLKRISSANCLQKIYHNAFLLENILSQCIWSANCFPNKTKTKTKKTKKIDSSETPKPKSKPKIQKNQNQKKTKKIDSSETPKPKHFVVSQFSLVFLVLFFFFWFWFGGLWWVNVLCFFGFGFFGSGFWFWFGGLWWVNFLFVFLFCFFFGFDFFGFGFDLGVFDESIFLVFSVWIFSALVLVLVWGSLMSLFSYF